MIPFVVLIAGWLLLRGAGLAGVDTLDSWQPALRGALALMFAFTATAHFGSRRRDLIAMVPAAFPAPGLLVTATGLLELAGAAGLLVPATAQFAAVGLALLLLALFPANVRAAGAGITIGGRPATPLGPRTVLQVMFLAGVVAVAI
jgi:uncharacterized membrane protein